MGCHTRKIAVSTDTGGGVRLSLLGPDDDDPGSNAITVSRTDDYVLLEELRSMLSRGTHRYPHQLNECFSGRSFEPPADRPCWWMRQSHVSPLFTDQPRDFYESRCSTEPTNCLPSRSFVDNACAHPCTASSNGRAASLFGSRCAALLNHHIVVPLLWWGL